MKIYAEQNVETDSVEVLLDLEELKDLVGVLAKFENELRQFKEENKEKDNLGFSHLHLIDCDSIFKNSESDIVFYVDLNK